MRVLLLNSLGIYGGGEFFVLELSAYLQTAGHSVWVGCKKDTPLYIKCNQAGIKTVQFDFPENGKGRLRKNISAIKEFINSNKIEIVHSNTNYDRTAGAFAAELSGAAHAASVHSLQSIRHNITHWTRNKFLVDKFIADGQSVKTSLIAKDKISKDKISVIHLGIDPASVKCDTKLRKKIRNEFGLNDGNILIGNLGRLVEFKCHNLLINSFVLTAKHNPDARLMIVGDGELRSKLEKQVQSLTLNDKVIFAGFRDDLQSVYSAFDIYAHTSESKGGELFPFAILYAMAAGLPIVSTDAGEIPNMISSDGYIAERDAEKISSILISLIKEPALREKSGNAALIRLKEEFTLEKMGSQILKLYCEILSKRNV